MSIGGQELVLYINNHRQLNQQKMAIAKNLATKKARGTYDPSRALTAWSHLANAAAKAYTKEHGSRRDKWSTLFPKYDREHAARFFKSWWTTEQKLGNFDSLLPLKYQKAKSRKAARRAMAVADRRRGKGKA